LGLNNGNTTVTANSYAVYRPSNFQGGQLVLSLPNLKTTEQVIAIPLHASQDLNPDGLAYTLGVENISPLSIRPASHHHPEADEPSRYRLKHLEFLQHSQQIMNRWQRNKPAAQPRAQAFDRCPAPYTINQKQCQFAILSGNNFQNIVATLRFVSANAYWFVQNEDVGDLSDQDLSSLAQKFEQITVPSDTRYFGGFPDADRNGKIFIVFSRILGPDNLLGYVAPWDLLPNGQVQGTISNEGDIFYAATPGSLSGTSEQTYLNQTMPATITHELKHLIASGVRVLSNKPSEELWAEEGSAQAAQELAKQGDNPIVSRFQLEAPHNFRLVYQGRPSDPKESQGIYGYSFLFLWRIAERIGHDRFWRQWVAGPQTGIANLERATGQGFDNLMIDWALTLALDHVKGGENFWYQGINLRDGTWQPIGTLPLGNLQGTARSMAYHIGVGSGNARIGLQTNGPKPYLLVIRYSGSGSQSLALQNLSRWSVFDGLKR
jgi:hypothetical protein